jgi:hypothetical protein
MAMKGTPNTAADRQHTAGAPSPISCPLCRHVIELSGEDDSRIECPACQLSFSFDRPQKPATLDDFISDYGLAVRARSGPFGDRAGGDDETTAWRTQAQARWRRLIAGGLAVGCLALLSLVVVSLYTTMRLSVGIRQAQANYQQAELRRAQAVKERDDAERRVRSVLAQRLAQLSQQVRKTAPARSAFLAGQAVSVAVDHGDKPDAVTEQVLRDAVAELDYGLLSGHADKISALAVSPDSRLLATGSYDHTVRLWDLTARYTAAAPLVLSGHEGRVSALAISQNNHWLVSGSFDGTVRIWNLGANDPSASVTILRAHSGRITTVAISPDSHWLVTASGGFVQRDNALFLWDLTAPDPAAAGRSLAGHDQPVQAMAVSADSRWLVTGSLDKTARVWNLASEDPSADPIVLRGHAESVHCVCMSADGRWIATAGLDSTARLWDMASDSPADGATVLKGHRGWIRALAISPDGRWLVTAGEDKTARLWDLYAANPAGEVYTLAGHEASIQAVAITPDSKRLITASLDKTARIWDLSAVGDEMPSVVLHGHDAAVQLVVVSPDNHWLITAGDDRAARLWNLNLKELAQFTRDASEGDPVIKELRRSIMEPVAPLRIRR